MCSHEKKNCPRCGAAFECKPGNVTQCQCFGLRFTDDQKKHIGERYADCLCRDCLQALQNEVERFREKFLKH
jgi:hypothetical protein